MSSLILLAALEDLLKWVGAAVFILLWALGPILKGIAERNAKRARDAQRANKAPGRGAAQAGGAPNPEAEVERFLREVARGRGGDDDQDSVMAEIVLGEDDLLQPVPPQPRPQRTPANKRKTRQRTSAPSDSIESRHLTDTLHDRPEKHSELEYADEKMADHVHDVFDHKLGQLGATTGPEAAPAAGVPIVSGMAIPTSAISMADLLRDPATVRQAILIHEILGPPRCESTDIGRFN